MAYIADLHTHSRFARACSGQLNISNLAAWASDKDIHLLGTSDFLHPLYLAEIKSQLKEDGSGFLTYGDLPTKFVLSVEVASIYTHKGGGRRVHNLILLPSIEAVVKFQQKILARRANLSSDGRPTVGIPSKDLLYMALEAHPKALFIPAHIWTPWFGAFGSKSGYNSLSDCFEDLADKVYAIETGLSSDPAMNWRVSELDSRTILSFSDAHSLPNLGREAVVFDTDLKEGYDGLYDGIVNQKVAGTIEFYPEEGMYHFTGHRNCNVKYSPDDEKAKGINCPVCGRPLTVGVMSRVDELASRSAEDLKLINENGFVKSQTFPQRPGYKMLIPLNQILAEAFGTAKTSQRVVTEYKKLVTRLGGEMKILTKVDLSDIEKLSGERVAEGVLKVRKGDLEIDPGFDGVYGVVKIWRESSVEGEEGGSGEQPQLGLFD